MRINFNQTNSFLRTRPASPGFGQNISLKDQKKGISMRNDTAVLSPQGKAASRLANLLGQKELIQMNKDSLLGQALDDETGAGSAGMKEKLEEYEEQLDALNEQIATEMAKQAEDENETENVYKKPQDTTSKEALDDSIARLTELSADLDKAKISGQANIRREGEKNVCKAEIKMGSTAAKRKLEKVSQMERTAAKIAPLFQKR